MELFNILHIILFGLADIQSAAAWLLPAAILGSAAIGGGASIFGGMQAQKAQREAQRQLRESSEIAEQMMSKVRHLAEPSLETMIRTPGLSPEELETIRFGQRRSLEDVLSTARQRLLQGLSQRGLLRSGIAGRGLGELERERIRGVEGLEQALSQQQIAQRRQDLFNAIQTLQGLRAAQASAYLGQAPAIAQLGLQGGLAQAQGMQGLGSQLLGFGGTMAGQALASQLYPRETLAQQLAAMQEAGLIAKPTGK